jgi:hypothetical protein
VNSIRERWGEPVGIEVRVPSLAKDERFSAWWAKFLRAGGSPTTVQALTRMNFDIDVRHVLPSIRVPTLLLHPTRDQTISVDCSRYMAQRILMGRLQSGIRGGADCSIQNAPALSCCVRIGIPTLPTVEPLSVRPLLRCRADERGVSAMGQKEAWDQRAERVGRASESRRLVLADIEEAPLREIAGRFGAEATASTNPIRLPSSGWRRRPARSTSSSTTPASWWPSRCSRPRWRRFGG